MKFPFLSQPSDTAARMRAGARNFTRCNLTVLANEVVSWRNTGELPEDNMLSELTQFCTGYCAAGDDFQEAKSLVVQVALELVSGRLKTTDPDNAEQVPGERLFARLQTLQGIVDDMSEDAFNNWLETLPQDELIEFYKLRHGGSATALPG